jgi:hypothetical protein
MEGLSARIAAHPGPRPSISLGVALANAGAEEWRGTVFEPVVPWDLRAWVDGREVKVRQPPLELGVRPRPVRLAAGESIELPSPIVLIFEEDDAPPDSAFVWVLGAPPPDAVELAASIKAGAETLELERTTVRLA